MKVKAKLIVDQNGTRRLDLPTYSIISIDESTQTAIAEIPDEFFEDEQIEITENEVITKRIQLNNINLRRMRVLYYQFYYCKECNSALDPDCQSCQKRINYLNTVTKVVRATSDFSQKLLGS